jgi:segregation and condensation protein B
MPRRSQDEPSPPQGGFQAPPADGGLSIDRLAQAFAAMMGTGDPYAPPATEAGGDVVHVDASPDLDGDAGSATLDDTDCRVNPLSILEALLFVGHADGRPLSSRTVAGLMRGVRPQEIDDFAEQLRRRCLADNCPYEVVAREDGWVMRLRAEFTSFGSVLESRARLVRLDAEALDALALVAWHQPVARDRLVELGCDARPAVLRQLVRRGLLELKHPAGDGEPVYHTTHKFLEVFKLQSLSDLPEPNEPPR